MSKFEIERALFVSRLSLERCNIYLAHLSALLHIIEESGENILGHDTIALLTGLEKELSHSAKSLANIG